MKYHILPILILLLTACNNSNNQITEPATELKPDSIDNPITSDPVPNSIENIQNAYELITTQKNQGTLDSTGFKYNCNNERSGTVSYFSHNGQLLLIINRYNEYSHYSSEDFYYVKDSTLFFVFNKGLSWSFDSGPQGSTRDNITEHRVYLIDQKPTRCLEKKYVIRSVENNIPSPDTIPNKEIKCSTVDVLKHFHQLLKYRTKAPSGCL